MRRPSEVCPPSVEVGGNPGWPLEAKYTEDLEPGTGKLVTYFGKAGESRALWLHHSNLLSYLDPVHPAPPHAHAYAVHPQRYLLGFGGRPRRNHAEVFIRLPTGAPSATEKPELAQASFLEALRLVFGRENAAPAFDTSWRDFTP